MQYIHTYVSLYYHPNPRAVVISPVWFWEQDGGVGLANEVFISHLADGDNPFFGLGLQGQGGLYFGSKHAQDRRQNVDEDLGGKER